MISGLLFPTSKIIANITINLLQYGQHLDKIYDILHGWKYTPIQKKKV